MPATHEITFEIRHYQCDGFGHLNNTHYVRFMQEAGFAASAAAGFSADWYAKRGQTWHIRESEIEYLVPLVQGESVTILTWVADYRRVRSRRVYEFRNTETGEPVARAHTDWIYLDGKTGRPASIPDEVIRGFFPEGAPSLAPRRVPLPPFPAPPEGIYRTRRRVEWRDIDPEGHVNNAVYLAYIQEAGIRVCAAHNWPMKKMIDHGFGIIPRRHRIEYLHPAEVDEELEVATWATNLRRSTATRYYTITRVSDAKLLARTQSFFVWVNLETGKPLRIPQEFKNDFKSNII